MSNILIKNGRVVDGTGNAWFRANVSITDGKISKIDKSMSYKAEYIINAKGLVVATG